MTGRWMKPRSCVLAGAIAGLVACTSTPPPARPQVPDRPLDLQLPPPAPDEATMARLPAAWDAETAAAAVKVETGPLQGAGNFNELDGAFISAYARNPYIVADGGDADRKLTTRLPADKARPFMEEANQAFGAGKLEEALLDYRKVIERDPLYAKAYFYVAEIESQRRDIDAATSWNDRGLRLSPRDPYGHSLRAEIMMSQGHEEVARLSLAYALALDPFSPRALKLLQRMGGRPPGIEPPILVQMQRQPGAPPVLVARGGGSPAWQRYAVCRALLTHDQRIRDEFVQTQARRGSVSVESWAEGQQSRGESVQRKARPVPPGALSLAEETTCGYIATAVYRGLRGAGPRDADLERWSRAYEANLLREAVIYETIGCRRPEVLPLLDDEELARMVDYVRFFVLSPAGPPAGVSATTTRK
jgi:tetratricopeptide (TPR) repeat protein